MLILKTNFLSLKIHGVLMKTEHLTNVILSIFRATCFFILLLKICGLRTFKKFPIFFLIYFFKFCHAMDHQWPLLKEAIGSCPGCIKSVVFSIIDTDKSRVKSWKTKYNKGNAKRGVSPRLKIWPGDLNLWT